MTISAKVICDSIANDVRLTTLELYYPRWIHSQFLTHRQFSRNASSSRAIPVRKNIDAVINDPAMPIHWGKNKSGMQADEECNELVTLPRYGLKEPSKFAANEVWHLAMDDSVEYAEGLIEAGYHKQIVNRLLEPFSHIKVICTATEFQNFFNLRLHDDAQPEIKRLAECMKEAMDNSTPNELKAGEWHLPYVDSFPKYVSPKLKETILETKIKCSVARVARVSYNNHDGSNPVIEKDIKLHDDLISDVHMSPTEHQATPMEFIGAYSWEDLEEGETHLDRNGDKWSGNFRGFVQYRQLVEGK